jgi:DNA mismatch repair protein MutH
MSKVLPPNTEEELLERCQHIAGQTLGQVAATLNIEVPLDLRRHKGWVGQLLETYLGADAGNQAEPDFKHLGIELKTLPLNAQGQPKESTYVCTVNLQESGTLQWVDSWVKRKLAHVLWLPVEADQAIPIAERYVGMGWLWQPDEEQTLLLQRDWEELMDRVVLGEQADITAKEGNVLQIRPKAANSRVMAAIHSREGESSVINPKGFYLRTAFTKRLLAAQKNK